MRAETLLRSSLLAALLLLGGCITQWHYDLGDPLVRNDYEAACNCLNLAQIMTELGPPLRVSATDNGWVMAWEHWRVKEDTLGFRLGAMGADLMSADWGRARVRGEFLLLTFDRQHRLTGNTYSRWDSKFGGGQAVQPLFSFVSLVDVDDLVDYLPQHRWGISALKPLPRAINRQSDPETGQNGIEQRGTPPTIGQRSLEMD